ncbi:MAG: tyrosine-protein phosphatase, partial [Actinomycetes bacterium]
TVYVPLEDGLAADPEFADWVSSGLFATPLYYRPFLHRWPDRCAAAVAAVGRAGPGGVVVHCSKGCDRTGMVIMFILATCGVSPEDIVADYELTIQRLQTPLARKLGRQDDTHVIQELLRRHGCPSVRSALMNTLAEVDVLTHLRAGGLSDADVVAVRQRLLA